MRVLIELEGVLCDVREARWAAYSAAVQAVGLARTDPNNFWRLLRTGAAPDRLITGAKNHQIDRYAARFAEALDADEVVAQYTSQEAVPALTACLAGMSILAVVTLGETSGARARQLRDLPPAWGAADLIKVIRPAAAGAGQLTALTSGQSCFVLASSEVVTRTAVEADLPVVGVAVGDCTSKRLAASGASRVFATLDALLEAVETGDEKLASLGLRAAPRLAPAAASPEDRELARMRDREARRRARLQRRPSED